jgi:pSer/pThr/pTyr-binding forkhead associated (FHA) protein
MADWLASFRKKSAGSDSAPVLELLVVEGADAGQQFTLDAETVAIARGIPKSGQPGGILLRDPTVSGRQAQIRTSGAEVVIEHDPKATNPTLVNGERVSSQAIAPGDRIQMGRVVLEVRARAGVALGGLSEHNERTAAIAAVGGQGPSYETTEVRPRVAQSYALELVSGGGAAAGHRYPIEPPQSLIGRDPSSQVHIDDTAVSRRHAELLWEGEQITLRQLSQVNQTFVNGVSVEGSVAISPGDEIRLADRVLLRLISELPAALPPPVKEPASSDATQTSLQVRMEQKILRDREIEQKYSVTGSFLDVDVVGSYGMKSESNRPEHIIVSFERWRSWVTGIVEEFGGMVLNSNGDELMCFFESTHDCVRSGSAILSRLDAFNADQNELASPFRLRVGAHTGSSLVDRNRGVAYSAVLDVAGHLQKDADVNGLLISEQTLQALPEGLPFEPAGRLEREEIPTYRLNGVVA